MEIEPKTITFSWTEKDWQRAHWQLHFRLTALGWLILAGGAWLGMNIGALLENYSKSVNHTPFEAPAMPWHTLFMKDLELSTIAVLLIGTWVLLTGQCRAFRGVKTYRLMPENFVNSSWEMNDDGLTYRQLENRVDHPWKLYQMVFFTRDFLMIRRQDGYTNMIPRSCFPDRGKAWHAVLSEKIKEAKKISSK